jgi:hypothetical protein
MVLAKNVRGGTSNILPKKHSLFYPERPFSTALHKPALMVCAILTLHTNEIFPAAEK